VTDFQRAYPHLRSQRYNLDALDVGGALSGAAVVLVHEWNDPELVRRIGAYRARHGDFVLLFHDTHHRIVSQPEQMADYDLRHYDGVLAFGSVIRDAYLERGWAQRAFTWHEAADTRVFRPRPQALEGDVVWVGNWGDEERTAELVEFLLEPVQRLGLRTRMYGVRYPTPALQALSAAGIEYGGWLPNYRAPEVFGRYRVTLHIPRRYYVRELPGIPTIRPFEALACGIPLLCAPWRDAEKLFTPGEDYLVAHDGDEMMTLLRRVLERPREAQRLARHGLATVRARHTCAHRAQELLNIVAAIRGGLPATAPPATVALRGGE
jgi:spore maturation protein CgeB